MRGKGAIVSAVGLALLASACNPLERMYFREGIGTELYSSDALPATELQSAYLDNLCRQSAPFVGSDIPSCSRQQLPPDAWPLIVLAGMNDIDARCDGYLAWLDQRKRENAAILSEIAAIRIAVDALTNPAVAGISPAGLAAVAAAFGLASATLGNINSLLLTVDHTTVQTVVFINRRKFREGLSRFVIANKPTAIHALRSYLQICMPMTISADINATVTVTQTAGPGFIGKQPLVSPGTIATPPATLPPPRADRPIVITQGPKQPAQGTVGPIETVVLGLERARQIQRAICVADSGDMSAPLTRAALVDFKAALFFPRKSAAINSGIIENDDQLAEIDKAVRRVSSCADRKLAGAYEAGLFGRFNDSIIRTRIRRSLEKAGKPVPAELANTTLPWGESIRVAVTTLRDHYSTTLPITKGTSIDEAVWTQITNENVVQ